MRWFELKSEAGPVGEIDCEKTTNGVIVCNDGLTATTVCGMDFLAVTAHLNVNVRTTEVDESSIFCEIARGARSKEDEKTLC